MNFEYSLNKGFSLIELLVAIAVIAILSTISVAYYKSYVEKAELNLVETVLRSAYSIIEDNKNFGITTLNIELNAMSIPKEQHKKAKATNSATSISTWRIILGGNNVTSIPPNTTEDWCVEINLGEVAYESKASCIDSTGNINHNKQPLSTSSGSCSVSNNKCQ